MPINILMPALSPTMEKGNLAKWLKKEGDQIKSGDVIAEIETDKATMEVEAVDEGILAKIVVPAGSQDVPVNQLIALIAGEGEDAKAVASGGGAAAPAPVAAPAAAPARVAAAASAAAAPPAAAPAASGSRVFASPLAKRIARQAGIDLSAVKGSGPHGRVVMADVEAAKAGGGAKIIPMPGAAAPAPVAAPAPAALASGPSADSVKKLFAEGSYEEVPHDNMRRTIARRLLESKQTVPHFYLTLDCELDALLALREQINKAAPVKDGKPVYKLSVNDMVIKAMAMALKAVPDANVSWTDNAMLKHRHADVGVAVSIPGGLITPVIRDACHKTLSTISNEMKDLAARAKARKLKPEEYQGGTTAVSNLGMFGVKDFAAIVNPPHATILAVGAGEQRAVVKNGQLAVATVMSVTLSTDHRAVDGALGAELMAAFKGYIENPMGMLV
ncbi:MAG: pyruvate dehydrogenase complex dihydrolipoamide acetyltransferase [Methylobacterium sp.]|nr:pyruvate dehydrogenase complex dihydrolipoamide acetyltransferase [Methylobacterium sp.]MCA3601788.1 pyruvate dehydrogenase complex dihydrolipoamide acetyltransferase [Methylobacterium sp.]MCA3607920.1 pyruvate dehydrogenase complex dihydrolipoamide acetyltransferase [Methylobacterium sp.]MCA3617299.1 pyruvate dehydrogenase complex dihydrolipoamide acetyltransferase [Methylobacterium sp.]MCA3620827.1 pyruvate dehydrogenase complex dihydrolipoamide acetyltransferase [Methylobacterium sp.]